MLGRLGAVCGAVCRHADNGVVRARGRCESSSSLAMSCVAFGVGAPQKHWSKKMRPTPAVAARRA
eukprot:2868591-Pleurochrysis_carterae.AAC.1